MYRNLPRPKYGAVDYDPEEMNATPETFEHRLEGQPPKLWVAWVFRIPKGMGAKFSDTVQLHRLFGGPLEVCRFNISVSFGDWRKDGYLVD